ncbi:YqaA family protein [Maritalea sp.]|uniref:YqaA family protein n=1 Tax=Maritalea sp. TaxID=2003361 RepID=UPI003EF2BA67
MIRRLYDWVLALGASKHAPKALGAISFAESSFFPIPPDIMLIPMVLAKREGAWRYALICTITSVLGGILGYYIGAALLETLARPILEFYGYWHKFEDFQAAFNDWGLLIVFVFGLTPFPYKVITIASGATGLNLPIFILSSIVSRGIRFFIVAALLYFFGPPIKDFIEKRLGLMFFIGCALLVGGFVAVKYLI